MNSLVEYHAPGTPTFDRYQRQLFALEDYRLSEPVPIAECHKIIAEATAALAPSGAELGKNFTRVLLGAYPVRDVTDPVIYTKMIASVFETMPPDICAAAIDSLTKTLKWLPTRAEVHEACTDLTARRITARRIAELHIKEHARREAEKAEEERREAENNAFRAQWGEAWDAWTDLPLKGRVGWTEFKERWGEDNCADTRAEDPPS